MVTAEQLSENAFKLDISKPETFEAAAELMEKQLRSKPNNVLSENEQVITDFVCEIYVRQLPYILNIMHQLDQKTAPIVDRLTEMRDAGTLEAEENADERNRLFRTLYDTHSVIIRAVENVVLNLVSVVCTTSTPPIAPASLAVSIIAGLETLSGELPETARIVNERQSH